MAPMLLFVYGTLRPCFGHPLGRALREQGSSRGAATVCGRLFDQGEYPVAIPSQGGSERIRGELFDLTESRPLWKTLDEYEDFKPDDVEHSLFERSETIALTPDGAELPAQIYWYRASVEDFAPIEGGDYFAFVEDSGRSTGMD